MRTLPPHALLLALQTFALNKLDATVDDFWAEISDAIDAIEVLSEDDTFADHCLAALVASKVYYHLGELDDALAFALAAGERFDLDEPSLYASTITARAMDMYAEQRRKNDQARTPEDRVTVDSRLTAIVDRMFERCFRTQEYRQAIGVAVESLRLDVFERAVRECGDDTAMLAYAYEVVMTLVGQRGQRDQFLVVIARLYGEQATADHYSMCRCFMVLNDTDALAAALERLVVGGGEQTLTGYQLAFDLYDDASQQLLAVVRQKMTALAAVEGAALSGEQAERVNDILAGKKTLPLHVEFMSRNAKVDKLILSQTIEAIGNNSICHNATVISNSLMYAGTTNTEFLVDNREWLVRAINWAKFSAIASLGVIHKSHTTEAMTVLEPYLPKTDGSQGSQYEVGGGFFALGLIHANHGGSAVDYLLGHVRSTHSEAAQHGACLGLGLAGMGTHRKDCVEQLSNVMYQDDAVTGEAAGIAIGLVMLGSGSTAEIEDMVRYAHETDHEKIIRGLALGIALANYGQLENALSLIDRLAADKDPILRTGACHTIALAYAGTGDNAMLRRLLHTAVSDVSDDVRRSAATALGFVLSRAPEQLPSVVALLCESFNPHVRYGSAMALGIACASTGNTEAIKLIEPLLSDGTAFVRQSAAVALGLIMMQQPNSHPKAKWAREQLRTMVRERHEDVLAKFGAIFAQGIVEAGGRNVAVSMCRDQGHIDVPTAVGLLLFSQFWSWFPMAHFLSLALRPTAVICLNADLKMPKIQLKSDCKPSRFAPPADTELPKEKEKEKVSVAVLSITSKTKAQKKKREAEEGAEGAASAMEGVEEEGAAAKEKADAKGKAADDQAKDGKEAEAESEAEPEPEPETYLLPNPARVVPAQLRLVSLEPGCRYRPVQQRPLTGGILVMTDSTPQEQEDLIETKEPTSDGKGSPPNAPWM